MPDASINLIKTSANVSPELAKIDGYLRLTSRVALILTLVTGSFLLLASVLLRVRLAEFDRQKKSLLASVASDSRKENALVVLKQRLGIIEKVRASVKPWHIVFAAVQNFASAERVSDVTLSDQGRVTVTVSTSSLEDMTSLVARVLALSSEKKLKNPVIESFTLNGDGSVQLSLSFVPVF